MLQYVCVSVCVCVCVYIYIYKIGHGWTSHAANKIKKLRLK